MGKHIYFLRHFITNNNLNGKLNGQSLEEPICEGQNIKYDFQIDMIYCSTALRCRQTVVWIAGCNQIIFSEQLLERNLGILEGHLREEVTFQYPELFEKSSFNLFATPPGGESYIDFYKRASQFWNFCSGSNNQNILICSHNQMLKMLYFLILEKTLTKQEWEQLKFPYGEIVKIM